MDDEGQEVEQGQVGEILVKGLTLCDEYYKNPEAIKEVFHGDWLGLGDMAYQGEEGFVYHVERKQDVILSGAINVYSVELEEVLYQDPKIKKATVIGVPHKKWGTHLLLLSLYMKTNRLRARYY